MMAQNIHDSLELFLIIGSITFSLLAYLVKIFNFKTKAQKKQETIQAFNTTIENLNSNNIAAQLGAAVHLRKFFEVSIKENNKSFLFKDTIGVITGMLKVIQTGVFQKTLGDGLAYAQDLSYVDIQKCNLQNIYLGIKPRNTETNSTKINLNKTDFYFSNLTDILIENATGAAIFYSCLLCNARIKNSNLSGADFRDSDLRGAAFINVHLENANFKGAKNIPEYVNKYLNDDMVFIGKGIFTFIGEGIFTTNKTPNTQQKKQGKIKIFFSTPGTMLGTDESKFQAWKSKLEQYLNCQIQTYTRDLYPQFGQLSQVRKSIDNVDALVCFGTKQIHIKKGEYRPDSIESVVWKDKWLSTPWCEIEISMAFMKGLPILLITDDDIDFGIFDKVITESQIQRISITENLRDIENNTSFRSWIDKITK